MSRSQSGSLPELFDDTLRHLESASPKDSPQDGFLFSGNRHESVPRALFFDGRLTPLERNAWQVIKLQLSQDGLTALSTYEQLRPFLASMPCGAKASHETVARALTMLRLTRWLSLVRRRRNPKTGRIQGNLYVLHDEPLTPFEAMQLDPDYLGLLSQALTHASQSIRRVGCQVLRELGEDPLLAGRILPSRLQVLTQRLIQGGSISETYPQEGAIHDSEEGAKTLLRNDEDPSSESEAGAKPAPEALLRNPKQDSTVRSTCIKEVRTVPRAREDDPPMPERFLELKEEQQAGALVALRQVDSHQRQAVLEEWDARCREGKIRNPAGYLFGIIQKAIRGEFKEWAGQSAGVTPNRPNVDDKAIAPSEPASQEVAQAHLTRIRAILQGTRPP